MKRLIVILFLCLFLFYLSHISITPHIPDKRIHVELRQENKDSKLLEFEKGDRFDRLLEYVEERDLYDLSDYSSLRLLRNNEVIELRYKKEKTKISINSADIAELVTLKGIGEATALRIIEYRKERGGFKALEEIMNVKGIKEKTFEKIKDDITL